MGCGASIKGAPVQALGSSATDCSHAEGQPAMSSTLLETQVQEDHRGSEAEPPGCIAEGVPLPPTEVPLVPSQPVGNRTSTTSEVTAAELATETQAFKCSVASDYGGPDHAARTRTALALVDRALQGGSKRTRAAALELQIEVLQGSKRCVEERQLAESEIWEAVESLFSPILILLLDSDPQARNLAVQAAVASAQCDASGLKTLLDEAFSVVQTARGGENDAELSSGLCCLLVSLIDSFLDPTRASDEIATSTMYLQAALWDAVSLIQQALTGALGSEPKDEAACLCVSVYMNFGVNESSQLLEGVDPAVVNAMFCRFAEAEETALLADEAFSLTGEAFYHGKHSPVAISAHRENLMDEILEEVGLAFHDDRLVRDKIVCVPSRKLMKVGDKRDMECELADLGLGDDLLQWAKDILDVD